MAIATDRRATCRTRALGLAVCLLSGGVSAGWATIEIVEPTRMSQPVGPNVVTLGARWWVGDEDHTAEATWKWTFPTGHTLVEGDPAELTGNPVWTVFRDPGSWHVTVQATGGGQTEELTITIHAFGGIFPEAGPWGYKLPLYFPTDESPLCTFTVRPGQPEGTTYQWAVNYGSDKAHIVGDATSGSVQVQGDSPSAEAGDVRLVLVYTHGGRSASWAEVAQPNLDVHKPTRPPSQRTDPSGVILTNNFQGNLWLCGRLVDYRAVSQLGWPMPGIPWTESIQRFADDPDAPLIWGPTVTAADGWIVSDWEEWGTGGDMLAATKEVPFSGDENVILLHVQQKVFLAGWTASPDNGMWVNEIRINDRPDVHVIFLN